ncbi:MAG: hypothetical protein A3F78_09200 [Burkholderiales bacterium RIFCSPLOWO2_12_FULL_61_40]|nr:MAG: hypothetical protein A3F78_09200 [Burkholderiales bacterium RIFCSPLOWO2_12_FULL_61_40]
MRRTMANGLCVYEGAVEVLAGASGASTLLQAGQQTHFTDLAADALAPGDPAREAWAKGTSSGAHSRLD